MVMWIFAAVNLILDVGNIAMFFVKKSDSGHYYCSFTCTGSDHPAAWWRRAVEHYFLNLAGLHRNFILGLVDVVVSTST